MSARRLPFAAALAIAAALAAAAPAGRAAQPRYRVAWATYLGGSQWDQAREIIICPDGSKVLYCSYLGGSGADMIRSVALGPAGEIYLVGSTASPDFPATPGAVQRQHRGKGDAFVVKLVPVK